MHSASTTIHEELATVRLRDEVAVLRKRLEQADRYTAQTLLRATRLSQVISVLANDTELDTMVGRAAVQVAELFAADVALLMLGRDDALTIVGQCGVRPVHLPDGCVALPAVDGLTVSEPVLLGSAAEVAVPDWLASYAAQHVAWARLLVGEESLGVMLLVRCRSESFEHSEETELRAIAHRIAMAIENGILHRRMREQLTRLRRLQVFTAELAGTLDLATIGQQVADMLVVQVPVTASLICVNRNGELMSVGHAGRPAGIWPDADRPQLEPPGGGLPSTWERFPLQATGQPIGSVVVQDAPAAGTEERELLAHVIDLAALALEKALLYEHSRHQARHDSLTGLLAHRAFQEELDARLSRGDAFSVVLIDIDDFKQVNDLHGHQAGDEALCSVASTLHSTMRADDSVFRTGGEEFCAVLPGLKQDDAYQAAERLRTSVAQAVTRFPVTISLGVATFPDHANTRDELLAHADGALYASKRAGKNHTTLSPATAGGPPTRPVPHGG
jgi:diguanylate cyclase (GGDEF)-like protein